MVTANVFGRHICYNPSGRDAWTEVASNKKVLESKSKTCACTVRAVSVHVLTRTSTTCHCRPLFYACRTTSERWRHRAANALILELLCYPLPYGGRCVMMRQPHSSTSKEGGVCPRICNVFRQFENCSFPGNMQLTLWP